MEQHYELNQQCVEEENNKSDNASVNLSVNMNSTLAGNKKFDDTFAQVSSTIPASSHNHPVNIMTDALLNSMKDHCSSVTTTQTNRSTAINESASQVLNSNTN